MCPEEKGFPGPVPPPLPFPEPWAGSSSPPLAAAAGLVWLAALGCGDRGCPKGSPHAVPLKTGSADRAAKCFSVHSLSYH